MRFVFEEIRQSFRHCLPAVLMAALVGCSAYPPSRSPIGVATSDALAIANRISWGVSPAQAKHIGTVGISAYVDEQLAPPPGAALPSAVQQQIDALTIQRSSFDRLVLDLDAQRRKNDGIRDDEDKKTAQKAYQQTLNQLQREAATRFFLRALYSRDQLREHMTWFWFNHFNVHAGKHDLRAMVGDYEENAIRAHALGRFRDLLAATARHPAMLRYLDNDQNAAGRINENYARELMELHTLGVDGGYSQQDVQELARVLTGFGVSYSDTEPKLKRELQTQYQRRGLFEFNPARHDYGSKVLLGQRISASGPAELDEALDILSRHPSTARYVSRKLATFLVSDTPSPGLLARMATAFQRTDGDIAAVLKVLFASDEFARSLGQKFRDPLHYVIASVRLAYDEKQILNADPMIGWLNRMAQPLYGRQTPDGYPLVESAWAGPGQLTARFEVARAIGSGSAGLFKTDGQPPVEKPAFPQLANALYYQDLQGRLKPATRAALDQAQSPQEWATLLLASPELMFR